MTDQPSTIQDETTLDVAASDPPQPILTVGALRDLLNRLTEQGISQDTAVVVATDGWYDELSAHVEHPLDRSENESLWVTLTPTGPADARFTSGHFLDDEPAVEPERLQPPIDVIANAFRRFWTSTDLSYKAGEYDACHYAAKQLQIARYPMPADHLIRQAADVAFALGQLGADQTTDRSFHAAIASILTGGEDVFEGGRP